MPGVNPPAAVEAFLSPLRGALACVGQCHITLSPGARGRVGETHSWTLNDGKTPMRLSDGFTLSARMLFEILDQGQSAGRERYRVSTREYIYEVHLKKEYILGAHWHPLARNSPYRDPHYHVGGITLAESGVFLERAHIRSPRVSLEEFIRLLIRDLGVKPQCEDWDERLARTEEVFDDYKHW